MREVTRFPPRFRFTRQGLLWALGLMIVYSFVVLPQYLRAKKSAQWPAADGVITVSQLREGSFKGMKGYWGQIEFRYRVGNKEYQSSSLSLGREHLAAREAWQPVLDEYSVGKSVKVYYDPRQPAVGILEPGLHGEMEQLYKMVLFFIGACSVGFVVVLLWYHDPEDV
jgi:hypothetical protein